MKYIVLLFIVLVIFTTTFAAEYTVPRAAYSVYSEDLDLDGDKDIVVGHLYNSSTNWTGITTLENINAEFSNIDSFYLNGQHRCLCIEKIDNNDEFDLITQCYNGTNSQIGILFDFYYNQNNLTTYNISDYCDCITIGDIDNDNDIDIIVSSSSGQFWGVLYNNGSGQFSSPEYHYVTGLHPTDIACGNLNEDYREDIVISGQEVQIYFSYESGFECYSFGDHELRIEIDDMDSDGDNDIVGLTQIFDIIGITIYENVGDNNFYEHEQVIYEINTPYFKISDLNNDNLPDIVCSGTYGVYILYNEGDLQLSEPQYFPTNTSGLSRPPFCADIDGNGYNDIITIRALFYTGILTILFNDGNGNFVEEPQVGINEECIMNNEKCRLTNYPNPFNPTTNICFQLSETDKINLSIYNIKGALIKKLINDKIFSKGIHSIQWDGKNNKGEEVNSNVYIYRLRVGNKSISKKMLLVR